MIYGKELITLNQKAFLVTQKSRTQFNELKNNNPFPGREEAWITITNFQVELFIEDRYFKEAEKLQLIRIKWLRKKVKKYLELPKEILGNEQKYWIRKLAISLKNMIHINPLDIRNHSQYLDESSSLFDIVKCDNPKNIEKSSKSSSVTGPTNDIGSLTVWGNYEVYQYEEALGRRKPYSELMGHLNSAITYYTKSLDFIPPYAVDALGRAHNRIAEVYQYAWETNRGEDRKIADQVISHYKKSVHYFELQNLRYEAAQARTQIAIVFAQSGQISYALDYAHAALINFESYGNRAAAEIKKAKRLIAEMEKLPQPG